MFYSFDFNQHTTRVGYGLILDIGKILGSHIISKTIRGFTKKNVGPDWTCSLCFSRTNPARLVFFWLNQIRIFL